MSTALNPPTADSMDPALASDLHSDPKPQALASDDADYAENSLDLRPVEARILLSRPEESMDLCTLGEQLLDKVALLYPDPPPVDYKKLDPDTFSLDRTSTLMSFEMESTITLREDDIKGTDKIADAHTCALANLSLPLKPDTESSSLVQSESALTLDTASTFTLHDESDGRADFDHSTHRSSGSFFSRLSKHWHRFKAASQGPDAIWAPPPATSWKPKPRTLTLDVRAIGSLISDEVFSDSRHAEPWAVDLCENIGATFIAWYRRLEDVLFKRARASSNRAFRDEIEQACSEGLFVMRSLSHMLMCLQYTISRLFLVVIYGEKTDFLRDALVKRPAHEIAQFFDSLESIRRSSHGMQADFPSAATRKAFTGMSKIDSACLEFGVKPPASLGVEVLRTFVTNVLCALRAKFMDFQDVSRILDAELAPLALLFPEPTDDMKGVPKHLHNFYTYLYFVPWPSIDIFDASAKLELPKIPVIDAAGQILKRGADQMVLSSVMSHILDFVRMPPKVLCDIPDKADVAELRTLCPRLSIQWKPNHWLARHRSAPFLWLALYLCHESDTTSSLLLSCGLIETLKEFHVAPGGSPDPHSMPAAGARSGQREVRRLCAALIYMMAAQASTRGDRAGQEQLAEVRQMYPYRER